MIGVLGGTGITGSQVVAALAASRAEFRCIVRDPSAAAAKFRLRNQWQLLRRLSGRRGQRPEGLLLVNHQGPVLVRRRSAV